MMLNAGSVQDSSNAIAQRTLLVMDLLSIAGTSLGVFAIWKGSVRGAESVLIVCGLIFSLGLYPFVLGRTRVPFQSIATTSTIFFSIYLCTGATIAILGPGEHHNLLVYLMWFFPLLVFNRLVNAPRIAQILSVFLRLAPVLILCSFPARLVSVFDVGWLTLLAAYSLSFISYGAMLDMVSRYREAFIVEQKRVELLMAEARILESISDCFISLDSEFRLTYLNDAACKEFALERETGLQVSLADLVPGFLSQSMLAGLHVSSEESSATSFEAQNKTGDAWYEMRCFPQSNGVSIYFRNTTESRVAKARIQHLAFHDALTGLPNRVLLRERLDKVLGAEENKFLMGALLFIDLDDFKTLNDTMGHNMGDVLLQHVALRLVSCARAGDTVARLGGDEFVVMLTDLSGDAAFAAKEAKTVSEKILRAFLAPFPLDGYVYESHTSIGIALFQSGRDSCDDLLKRADLAMYRAKAQGRNTFCFFHPEMETFVASRAELQSDLRRGLQNKEFEVYYQAQMDNHGRVMGAEALLRWRHPRRGMVPPFEFIPLAEEAGLILDLGRWVLETACLQLARWAGNPAMRDLSISVNVSPRQVQHAQFVDLIKGVLRTSGANARQLKLEITESAAMERVTEIVDKIGAIRLLGIRFSLDDFGTGYSSLSRLKQLPLDELKIDRSFIKNITSDGRDASVMQMLITLGHCLNLTVIAEGVETSAQKDLLESQGCFLYQGYLYSPALPVSEFEDFVVTSAAADEFSTAEESV